MERVYSKHKISKLLLNTLMVLFSITCLFPVIWIFFSSMKTQQEFMLSSMALPKSINFQNYIDVFQSTNMLVYIWNSLRNTIVSLGLTIIVVFPAAYVLSRRGFKGRNFIYNYFIIGMLIPVHALLVPMYIQFKQAGIDNQWYTLIIPYVAFGIPISVMLMESYIKSIPVELEDAAAIDGCGFFKTMLIIVLPLATPVLATVAIIQFFASWNEFSFALILVKDDALRTIPVGLNAFKGAHDINYPRFMAAIMASMIPAMLLYFSFSKRIISGMMAGAVKG